MSLTSVFVALLVIAVTFLSCHFIYSLLLKPKRLENFLRNQGFGGNPYRPINGDQTDITRMAQSSFSKPMPTNSHDLVPRFAPFVQQLINKHGENTFTWNGRTPKVNIVKPELLREIFSKYDVFTKLPVGSRSTFGLVLRDGDDWAKVRRIINPAFHMEKLKSMLPLMEESVDTMLSTWEDMAGGKDVVEVDVYSSLSSMAGDVIARTSFGSSYEQGKRLFQLEHDNVVLKFQNMLSFQSYIPGSRYLPTKTNRKIKQLENEITKLVNNIVENKKKAIKAGDNNKNKVDLLSIMLESNEKDIKEHGVGLTMEELIVECRLFLLAGKDTTSSLLTWSLLLLTQYKDWQTKARDEVLEHFGKDLSPTFEGLNALKIVNMILHETLRFYPPVPELSRVIAKDTNLKNISLSHDIGVSIPTLVVHRDPKLWGNDAHEFNPSRFSNGVSNASTVQGSFCPFGGGPRTCIGQNFALIEAKLALAKILQRFTFEVSPSYVHSPIPIIGLVPQHGAPLILHKI